MSEGVGKGGSGKVGRGRGEAECGRRGQGWGEVAEKERKRQMGGEQGDGLAKIWPALRRPKEGAFFLLLYGISLCRR